MDGLAAWAAQLQFGRLTELLVTAAAAVLCICFHETCHGLAALWLGDPTAKRMGRLSLNPMKHIDPMGLVMLVVAKFGWAKPVPVNARYYKNPRRGMALTAAAGPLSNLLLALIGIFACETSWLFMRGMSEGTSMLAVLSTVFNFCYLLSLCNISLAVFNLIPVPPFDGSRILYVFLPPKQYFGIMRYERYIMLAVLVLFAIGAFDLPLSLATDAIFSGMVRLVELIPIFR
jgi:Zn-dependent protease